MRRFRNAIALGIALVFAPGGGVAADFLNFQAARDNTLYQDNAGSLSNGAGAYFFTGRVSTMMGANGERRRALIFFNLSGAIPAGSTINSVVLTLNTSAPPVVPIGDIRTHTLHRVTANWGEGASDAADPEGLGAAAQPGDATWLHRFFSTQFWSAAGGDFVAAASASQLVGVADTYTWGSTAAMVANVQAWVDNATSNFGWMLLGDESTLQTARRFVSRENGTVASRPVLTVNFTVPAQLPGALVVNPATDLTSSGLEGGPFAPPSKTYTLTNSGDENINVSISKGQAWVGLSTTSVLLSGGANTPVTVSIASSADGLDDGIHSDTVTFANTTNGFGNTTREVQLSVIERAISLPWLPLLLE